MSNFTDPFAGILFPPKDDPKQCLFTDSNTGVSFNTVDASAPKKNAPELLARLQQGDLKDTPAGRLADNPIWKSYPPEVRQAVYARHELSQKQQLTAQDLIKGLKRGAFSSEFLNGNSLSNDPLWKRASETDRRKAYNIWSSDDNSKLSEAELLKLASSPPDFSDKAPQQTCENCPKPVKNPLSANVLDLKKGDENDNVKELQTLLVKLNYMTQSQMKTGPGIFGKQTNAALIEFQKKHNLPQTGIVDQATVDALQTADPLPAPPPQSNSPDIGDDCIASGFILPTSDINTSNYGYKYAQKWTSGKSHTLHTAVDINTNNDCGRAVIAIGNGKIVFSGHGGGQWGGIVLIQHRYKDANGKYQDVCSQYAHIAPLDSLTVGDCVKAGQTIGYIADISATKQGEKKCPGEKTGKCSDDNANFDGVSEPAKWDVTWCPHLHFEIRTDISLPASNWIIFKNLDAPETDRITAVNAAGYTDPLEFIKNHPLK